MPVILPPSAWDEWLDPDEDELSQVFVRAVERGEIDGRVDGPEILRMIAGIVLYHVVILQVACDGEWEERVTDLVQEGKAPVYIVHFTQAEALERAQGLLSLNFITKDDAARIGGPAAGVDLEAAVVGQRRKARRLCGGLRLDTCIFGEGRAGLVRFRQAQCARRGQIEPERFQQFAQFTKLAVIVGGDDEPRAGQKQVRHVTASF